MKDPALKNALSAREIEHLSSTADFRIVQVRTPGLTPLSEAEWLLGVGVVFAVGTALYIHLDVKPFLPFQIPPALAPTVKVIAFWAMGIGALWLLSLIGVLLYVVALLAWYRLFPPQPRITCPECGASNLVKRYADGQGCSKCDSRQVYCARCGKPSDFQSFLVGAGCPHCRHQSVAVRW